MLYSIVLYVVLHYRMLFDIMLVPWTVIYVVWCSSNLNQMIVLYYFMQYTSDMVVLCTAMCGLWSSAILTSQILD